MLIKRRSFNIVVLIAAGVVLVLLGGSIGLAYMGGVFTGKDAVIANDQRILNQAAKQHSTAVDGNER